MRGGMRALLGVFALWTGAPSPSPATRALSWDAPLPGCPSPEEVGQRLDALLGARSLEVDASARVRAAGATLRLDLRVQWRGRVDERTLEADTCESLAEAAVVLVALMAEAPRDAEEALPPPPVLPAPTAASVVPVPAPIEEAGLAEAGLLKAGPPAEVEPPEETPVTPPAAPMTTAGARAKLDRGRHASGFSFAVLGLVDLGSLAAVSGGLHAALSWRWPRARVFMGGTYLPPHGVGSRAAAAAQGRVQLGIVQLGACVRLGPPRVEVPLCAALEAGGSRGTGFGVAGDRGARDPWLAFAAGPAVLVSLSRAVALILRVEAAVPLIRSRYIYGDEATLFETAPVAVRGGLGLEFRIPNQFRREPENR